MPTKDRKTMDCRRIAGSGCTLTISGTEQEVMDVAMRHAVERHGAPDSPEMRERLREALIAESGTSRKTA